MRKILWYVKVHIERGGFFYMKVSFKATPEPVLTSHVQYHTSSYICQAIAGERETGLKKWNSLSRVNETAKDDPITNKVEA